LNFFQSFQFIRELKNRDLLGLRGFIVFPMRLVLGTQNALFDFYKAFIRYHISKQKKEEL